jgi:hypothetical protein
MPADAFRDRDSARASLLAFTIRNAEVRGLTAFAREQGLRSRRYILDSVMVGLDSDGSRESLGGYRHAAKGVMARHRWLLRALAIVALFDSSPPRPADGDGRDDNRGGPGHPRPPTPSHRRRPGRSDDRVRVALFGLGAIVITLTVATVRETMNAFFASIGRPEIVAGTGVGTERLRAHGGADFGGGRGLVGRGLARRDEQR